MDQNPYESPSEMNKSDSLSLSLGSVAIAAIGFCLAVLIVAAIVKSLLSDSLPPL